MDEYGHFNPRGFPRHLRSVDPDDMYPDAMPYDFDACERLEREARDESLFSGLIALVGDAPALRALDADPIPDEPFDWSAVEPEDRSFVAAVVGATDRCCDGLLDVEFRTIVRRIVARVARRDPRAFRRSTNVARTAAAFVWLAGRANGEFGRRGPRSAHRLWDWFGVGSAADRARSLRSAAGLEPSSLPHELWSDEMALGDVSLLHSNYRAQLIRRRDSILEFEERRRTWKPRDDGTVEVKARPAEVVVAGRAAVVGSAAPMLLLGLGEDVEHADFFSLTIAEAKSLVARVQHALDGPPPGRPF